MKTLLVIVNFLSICLISFGQEDAKSFYYAGNSAFSEKQYDKALELYEKALTLGISDSIDRAWILGYAGMCYEELNQPQKAKEYYTNSILFGFPNTAIYNKMVSFSKKNNDLDGQEFALINLKKKFPEETDNVNSKLVTIYNAKKDNSKLLVLYDEMIARDSSNYRLFLNKGNILAQQNKRNEAKNLYNQALKLNPEDAKANMYLGLMLYNEGTEIYDREKAKYNRLKTPTTNDYVQYQRNVMKGKNLYNEAEPYLVRAYNAEQDATVKKALFNIYDRTDQPAKAQKYK
jgi:tetratricopeptide (TPR) repeat protein